MATYSGADVDVVPLAYRVRPSYPVRMANETFDLDPADFLTSEGGIEEFLLATSQERDPSRSPTSKPSWLELGRIWRTERPPLARRP
jgi:hypothetical protein